MILYIMLSHCPIWQQKGGCPDLDKLLSFIMSVLASVVAYYLCKWLDRHKQRPTQPWILSHYRQEKALSIAVLRVFFFVPDLTLLSFCLLALYHMFFSITIFQKIMILKFLFKCSNIFCIFFPDISSIFEIPS